MLLFRPRDFLFALEVLIIFQEKNYKLRGDNDATLVVFAVLVSHFCQLFLV